MENYSFGPFDEERGNAAQAYSGGGIASTARAYDTAKTEEERMLVSRIGFKYIHVRHLPGDNSAVTPKHAQGVLPGGLTGDDEIGKSIVHLRKFKSSVQAWARAQIKIVMFQEAWEVKMVIVPFLGGAPVKVRRYAAIGESWRMDGSLGNAEKLFQVLYGWFDTHPWWFEEMECDYMEKHGYQYHQAGFAKGATNKGSKPTYGCIARLIKNQKNEMVKNINAKSVGSHGKKVTITRDNITSENRNFKTQKGVFHHSFVKNRPTAVTRVGKQIEISIDEPQKLDCVDDSVTVMSIESSIVEQEKDEETESTAKNVRLDCFSWFVGVVRRILTGT